VSSNVYTELSRSEWHHDLVHDLSSQPPQCDLTIDDPVNDTGLGHQHGDLQVFG